MARHVLVHGGSTSLLRRFLSNYYLEEVAVSSSTDPDINEIKELFPEADIVTYSP